MLTVRFGLDCGRDVEGLIDDRTRFWNDMNNREKEWISITTTAGLMSVRKTQIATITWKEDSALDSTSRPKPSPTPRQEDWQIPA